MKVRRCISIRVSLATAFAITVITTASFIGMSNFVVTRAFIRDGIRLRLENITTMAAARLDAATHANIRTRADENSAEYARIKLYLKEIKAVSPDIRFVYTYRIDPAGKVSFVVDAEDATSTDMSHVGEEYDEVTPLMRHAYKASTPVRTENAFTTDKWGTWLSCYGSVTDATGGVECALGIDMSGKAVRDYERHFLLTIIWYSAIIGVIALLGSLWYSRSISRPLLKLADDLGRVQRLELDHGEEIRSSIKEVVIMREAIYRMKNGLRSFRKYVPADLVADLMELGQEARLSAENRETTIFFSDIVGFTAISEQTPPEQLVEDLAIYFDGMTRSIIESKGTVDKYIGDAIMAFWGAPRPLPDHAVQACLAAIKCRNHSRIIGAEQRKKGKAPMDTRIGLNTGAAIIGNIGYDERLNYTAMGDVVNLASRLEGLNKFYGTQILISESTWQLAKDAIDARFIDVVAVKGKQIPVRVYEVICERGGMAPAQEKLVAAYETAMQLYLAREFKECAELFEKLSAAHPDDRAISRMLERSRQFIDHPPPPEWQGEFVMSDK